jgi:hypothetical protein
MAAIVALMFSGSTVPQDPLVEVSGEIALAHVDPAQMLAGGLGRN